MAGGVAAALHRNDLVGGRNEQLHREAVRTQRHFAGARRRCAVLFQKPAFGLRAHEARSETAAEVVVRGGEEGRPDREVLGRVHAVEKGGEAAQLLALAQRLRIQHALLLVEGKAGAELAEEACGQL
jgi:hypothetical protein